jgi:hypothetical protein
MMIKKQNLFKDTDELFEYATEDASTYHWAVSEWSEYQVSDDYDPEYLLFLALSSRKRSRTALELLNGNLPPKYQSYKNKLEAIYRKADIILENRILSGTGEMEKLLNGPGEERIAEIRSLLYKVRRIAQNGDVFSSPEFVEEDLRDTAHDFLIMFQDTVNACDELNHPPLSAVNSDRIRKSCADLENDFRKYFGYFSVISDLLPVFCKSEYGAEKWWLHQIPDAEDVQEENADHFLDDLKDHLKEQSISGVECSQAEAVIAYAMNEAEAAKIPKIRSHLIQCSSCLRLFTGIRTAEA